jgi:hypothetical protein
MPIIGIIYSGDHQILVEHSNWVVWIKYDGRKVSEKRGLSFSRTHVFRVIENGEPVDYVVEVGLKGLVGTKMRATRNGILIHSDEKGFQPPPHAIMHRLRADASDEIHVSCPYCGSPKEPDDAQFCARCGNRFDVQ